MRLTCLSSRHCARNSSCSWSTLLEGFGFRVSCFGFRVSGFGFRVCQDSWCVLKIGCCLFYFEPSLDAFSLRSDVITSSKIISADTLDESLRKKSARFSHRPGRSTARQAQQSLILHFEPSLDALSLRPDVISSIKILSSGTVDEPLQRKPRRFSYCPG